MKRNGFTLIEVMVVIIMIGILAAVAIPIYSGYVYRARATEGVTMLGAVKTYALEYRTSKGEWPEKADLDDAFNSFNDLFYFSKTITIIESNDRYAVRIDADDEFGLSSSFTDGYIQLDFSIANTEEGQTGWSGGIIDKYADWLPQCTKPLTS